MDFPPFDVLLKGVFYFKIFGNFTFGVNKMNFNGINFDTYFNNYPDKDGYFGKYGGVYIDDKLKAAMAEITEAY